LSDTAEPEAPTPAAEPPAPARRDPVRRWVAILLIAAAVLFVYTVIADRLTPFSTQASVQAFLVRMAPEVPGRVVEIGVIDNEVVKADELLFRIDPRPYEIAVDQASAKLGQVGQTLGASTSSVETAQAKVADALANRNNARDQAGRILELVRRGVYPPARGDDASATLARAEAGLQGALSELERARRQLGPAGADNPQLREALAGLESARLNLLHTQVFAPGAGVVTNLQLSPGGFVAAGQPALTFIDARAIWITVMMRENSLEFIKKGTTAEIVFDALPGRVFRAQVQSVGWGIGGTAPVDSATGLLTQPHQTGESRRFPVTLVLAAGLPPTLRYGSQATVLFYAGGSVVMDIIGGAWLRIYSYLTYFS
jgi:multidrug resistance efflux pump